MAVAAYYGHPLLTTSVDQIPIWHFCHSDRRLFLPAQHYICALIPSRAVYHYDLLRRGLQRCRVYCDIFGTKALGAIHGCILTAWSAAGICGPMLYAYLNERTGSPELVLRIFAAAFIVAMFISFILRFNIASIRKKKQSSQSLETSNQP